MENGAAGEQKRTDDSLLCTLLLRRLLCTLSPCRYDIRAASSGHMKAETLMDLSAGDGRTILTFRAEGERVLAGMEQEACHLWAFSAEEKHESDSDKDTSPSARQKKKNKGRCPKQRKKYPKRTTR